MGDANGVSCCDVLGTEWRNAGSTFVTSSGRLSVARRARFRVPYPEGFGRVRSLFLVQILRDPTLAMGCGEWRGLSTRNRGAKPEGYHVKQMIHSASRCFSTRSID